MVFELQARPLRGPSDQCDLTGVDWKRPGAHLEKISEYPRCVCFNCGMTMYPSKAKETICALVQKREDCRAYRVFEYYIKSLVENTQQQREHSVFH